MGKGKLFLVGLGPGARDYMSGRARQAIAESEVVIGYTKYIDLIEDLLDGKDVVRRAMTQEIERCTAACERAKAGQTVALVSSGDIGVYGMAGLAYEVLLQSGWTPGEDIDVEVVPGITALSACASLVGAPLSHDFCSISLSDLLTPWPVIARRLEAAARGDFVLALYNPKSGRRQGQLLEARRILLQQRRPDTPVAIVNAAYRNRQVARLVTLERMADCEIGMLSTVLIGSRSTRNRAGLMITPRGYGRKYDGLAGGLRAGERSGRSLSMGLDGWKACVRSYLRETDLPSLEEAACHFDAPMGEILAAVSEATAEDTAGDWAATPAARGGEAALLDAARSWGPVCFLVRSGTGAESELMLDARELIRSGDRLVLQNAHCRLRVDWSRVRQAWLFRRDHQAGGLQFLDTAGDTVFALFLVQRDGRYEPGALARFERAWRQFPSDRGSYGGA